MRGPPIRGRVDPIAGRRRVDPLATPRRSFLAFLGALFAAPTSGSTQRPVGALLAERIALTRRAMHANLVRSIYERPSFGWTNYGGPFPALAKNPAITSAQPAPTEGSTQPESGPPSNLSAAQ